MQARPLLLAAASLVLPLTAARLAAASDSSSFEELLPHDHAATEPRSDGRADPEPADHPPPPAAPRYTVFTTATSRSSSISRSASASRCSVGRRPSRASAAIPARSSARSRFLEGAMAGAGTAILIDAFALSWDTPHPRSDGAAVRWSPTVSLGLQGATAGVGGAF